MNRTVNRAVNHAARHQLFLSFAARFRGRQTWGAHLEPRQLAVFFGAPHGRRLVVAHDVSLIYGVRLCHAQRRITGGDNLRDQSFPTAAVESVAFLHLLDC